MRRVLTRVLFTLAAALLSSCAEAGAGGGPPLDRLYFPAGIAHVDGPGGGEGVLFVANANLDKRYGSGSVVALALDQLGLPAFGAATGAPVEVPTLAITQTQSVQIASFAGELAVEALGAGRHRLVIPTRSERNRVYRVVASLAADGTPSLACPGGDGQDCVETGASLSPREFEQSDAGVPRAPSPYGATFAPRTCGAASDCCPAGEPECGRSCAASGRCIGRDGEPFSDLWVTHLTQADSPLLSGLNLRAYLVRLDSDDFAVSRESFIETGWGGTNSIVAHNGWVYASGRFINPQPNLVRMARRDGVVALSGLESTVRVSESRGLAVSTDGKRLFLLGRVPDSVITLSLDEGGALPKLEASRASWLPDGPNELRVISRAGRGDLLVITCSTAGAVVLYDEDVGDVVATLPNLGSQPYSIAVDQRGSGARVFVSLFGDGRIAVIDIPDVSAPRTAHLVARVGPQQVCLTRGANSPACRATTGGVP